MRRMLTCVLAVTAAAPAWAVFCARDVVPAATLLVPYVEVTMNGAVPDRERTTTILRVTNTAPEATLVQLIVWDALGEPVAVFHAALSGYDMWTVDFADVLEGRWSRFDTSRSATAFPNTETAVLKRTPFEWGPDGRSGFDPPVRAPYTSRWSTGLQNPGKTSELDGGGCGMPYGDTTGLAYAPLIVEKLQDPLFSRSHGGCPGAPGFGAGLKPNDWLTTITDNPLIFYATAHVVRTCSALTPADAGHAALVASDRNVLLGTVTYLDPAAGTLERAPVTHIEAASTALQEVVVGPFEARTGIEDRLEPLGTAFAFNYVYNLSAASHLVVWKPFWELGGVGPLENRDGDVLDCGAYMYYAWDEDEHVISAGIPWDCGAGPCCRTAIDSNETPFVTQRVPITQANFDLPSVAGWMLLILPPSYAGFTQDPTPGANEAYPRYQAAVAVRTVVQAGGATGASWAEAAVVGHAQCQTGGVR